MTRRPFLESAAAERNDCCRWLEGMKNRLLKKRWSLMEDFSKAPGGKDFIKMKAQYVMFVDDVSSNQVCVSVSP